jgi:hypothetical protein
MSSPSLSRQPEARAGRQSPGGARSVVIEQLQARAVGPGGRDEAGGGGTEDELQHLAVVGAHEHAPALFVHALHDARLKAAAEVRDARTSAHARDRS